MPEPDRPPAVHAVILAGGSGVRFWPLSRELSPKQFVSIFGGESLVAKAVARGCALPGAAGVHVVTGERLLGELRNHLSDRPEAACGPVDYIVEPAARNTAAAIALAAACIDREDPGAVMAVLPSDHLLEDSDEWRAAVSAGVAAASEGLLATIGLIPTRCETGYGYILGGEPATEGARLVERFVEKPDLETAQAFVSDGRYLWNSGMVLGRADVVLSELDAAGRAAATPESSSGAEIAAAARKLAAMDPGERTGDDARELFESLPSVPFDKAVLEVSDKVVVVPTSMAWSDVGSLLAVAELAEPDERGNVLVGRSVDVDSRDIIAYSADRLVATLGLKDVLVIDTADATLVADKARCQDVRLIVDALAAAGAREIIEPRMSLRPWGSWTLLLKSDGFQVKQIVVDPGKRLSLQRHGHRSEHWVVVAGSALVRCGDDEVVVAANESIYVEEGQLHRLDNPGDEPLIVVEVAVGDYLGEDDIERFEDDWSR